MLGYRRNSFKLAHALLRRIADDPSDIIAVLECQRVLFREILRAEGNIQRLKREAKTLRVVLTTARSSKNEAQSTKRQLKRINKRIDDYQLLAFVWRCFGDGIAFTYLDKYAIKQTFYETATSNAKQDAGALSGKEGLSGEIAVLEDAAAHDVPAVLVDLTNSIRHGDVCLLGASDPYLIEVKSSGRLSGRGQRQVNSIDTLHDFFAKDTAPTLRGFENIRRATLHSTEVRYVREMNDCIGKAKSEGHAVISPEPGLFYIAMYRGKPRDVFRSISGKHLNVCFLNDFKTQRAWAPYEPFTLSIYDQEHLYDFIRGKLFLFVISDLGVVRDLLDERGYDTSFDNKGDYLWRTKHRATEAEMGLSAHLYKRVSLEFLALSWLVNHHCNIGERMTAGEFNPNSIDTTD